MNPCDRCKRAGRSGGFQPTFQTAEGEWLCSYHGAKEAYWQAHRARTKTWKGGRKPIFPFWLRERLVGAFSVGLPVFVAWLLYNAWSNF